MLGDIAIDAPALRVLEDDGRALSTPGLAGNIGGAVLGRFVVTFDYARGAVWLAPNDRLGAPFHLDRSGLRIHTRPRGFEIVAVMAGSPAADAGLSVDDVIVAVDGTPASGIPLHAQRRALQEAAPGTRVAVRVQREGVAFDAGFTLRDLVPAR
jgi:membrane-associated protease RseP (regulator of RpoE activity)